jgi:hypothetical protein
MSVPPAVLQRMMAQRGGAAPATPPPTGGAPGAPGGAIPGGAPGATPPQAAPMAAPQEKAGLKAAAMTNVHIAMNMLEEALPAFGSESKEGQKIMRALTVLGNIAGKRDSGDLVPAQVLQMVRQLPQAGGGTEVQKMLMRQMAGGGAPGGAPAGAGQPAPMGA